MSWYGMMCCPYYSSFLIILHTQLPPHSSKGNKRTSGIQNPLYISIYTFPNDFSAVRNESSGYLSLESRGMIMND